MLVEKVGKSTVILTLAVLFNLFEFLFQILLRLSKSKDFIEAELLFSLCKAEYDVLKSVSSDISRKL